MAEALAPALSGASVESMTLADRHLGAMDLRWKLYKVGPLDS